MCGSGPQATARRRRTHGGSPATPIAAARAPRGRPRPATSADLSRDRRWPPARVRRGRGGGLSGGFERVNVSELGRCPLRQTACPSCDSVHRWAKQVIGEPPRHSAHERLSTSLLGRVARRRRRRPRPGGDDAPGARRPECSIRSGSAGSATRSPRCCIRCSTAHTKLRDFLFLPWIFAGLEDDRIAPSAFPDALKRRETQLIGCLRHLGRGQRRDRLHEGRRSAAVAERDLLGWPRHMGPPSLRPHAERVRDSAPRRSAG